MNHPSPWRALFIALLVVLGAVALGVSTYHAGVANGIAESGRAIAAPPAGTPYVYVWPRPWGFGFFPIFPIFFLLFFFFAARSLLWRGPWRGGCGWRHGGVPPAFEEWHRRAHGDQPSSPRPTAGSAT